MTPYLQYDISSTDEVLVALLSAYDFQAFEERENQTIAYISEDSWSEALDAGVKALCKKHGAEVTLSVIEPRNWNAAWESNFSPVDIGSFCTVRADFHPPADGYKHVIHLQPKMAFGTGHHETTYMMIAAMEHLSFANKSVLDYGCGTGILAILAKKLNASKVDAIDIEEESYLNTLENAKANTVQLDTVQQGTIESIDAKYDIILANINRNVLLHTAKDTLDRLEAGGHLLMSGILQADRDVIISKYQGLDLTLEQVTERGEWLCLLWRKG